MEVCECTDEPSARKHKETSRDMSPTNINLFIGPESNGSTPYGAGGKQKANSLSISTSRKITAPPISFYFFIYFFKKCFNTVMMTGKFVL